ncbi:PAS domain S-box-containing protein [Paraburkholderia sp. BL23I1N1]|uniref:PAS domain-containing sensor histidine kinase n=1 Tax=Paraburkholderia sp. BL23I1N1 TaxID=1938802 RepID=UPI000E7109F5|nr:sensor histidine kinase [Paraburkholderia sp. BL23I1N1]RKE38445.1 PAS domain S-box-containing protein [Paraburkholderia sp. BL23I1N1]
MNESARDAETDAILKRLEGENAALRRDRENLERLVAERNELLHLTSFALNRVREAAYLLDDTGRFVYVNKEACRTLGYSNAELLLMSVSDIDPDWTADRGSEAWPALREQGSLVIETMHRRKDGSLLPVQVNASFFEYGDKEYNLALARDVTKLRTTERALRESERAFRTLAENAPDAIVRYDLNCRRTYVNPEFARVTGVEVEQLLGEPREVLGAKDELGQHLSALRMGVSTLRVRFGHDNPDIDEHVQKLLLLSDKTMQVLRNVMTSLRPAVLDAGIAAALEWLTAEFSQNGQTTCCLSVPEESRELAEERAIALFRIVQEALTNVTRHADAHQVFITLKEAGDDCLLEVRDDGRGFDPVAIPRKSFGLAGMRERVLMLGGALDVVSSPGHGTAIKVRVPFGRGY